MYQFKTSEESILMHRDWTAVVSHFLHTDSAVKNIVKAEGIVIALLIKPVKSSQGYPPGTRLTLA